MLAVSNSDDGYTIGYGRPPKETQWKKGQCGNPKRIRKRAPKRIARIIHDAFEEKIDIAENGVARRVSVFEAIALQLWLKATSGDRRALSVLFSYLKHFSPDDDDTGFEIVYVDNDYTRMLRNLRRVTKVGDKNE